MNCEICNETFIPASALSKYCSQPCRTKANNLKQKEYKAKWYLNSVGRDEKIVRTSKGRWIHKKSGYVLIEYQHRLEYEHRVLAEKALGKLLPPGAIVHHMVAPDDNHGFCKLVICPSQEYHFLLHKRIEACGL